MVMDDRVTWSLENGPLIIDLEAIVPRRFFKSAGMTGTGIAPRKVNITSSAAGGGRFRSSVRQPRVIDIPIAVYGEDRDEVGSYLRQLVRVFDDTFGTPKLVATFPNGDQYESECHYTGGGDHQWGSSDTDGRTYCRWPISLICPDPLWRSRDTKSVTIGTAGASRGLIRAGNGGLTRLRVSSSQVLGSVTISNDGDADAYPTWTLKGPLSNFHVRRPSDGAELTFQNSIAQGQTVTIDTRASTITDQGGQNLFSGLAGAPRFFTIPPGTNTLVVEASATGSDTLIALTFAEVREVIF